MATAMLLGTPLGRVGFRGLPANGVAGLGLAPSDPLASAPQELNVENVEKLMQDSAEAMAYHEEVAQILSESLSAEVPLPTAPFPPLCQQPALPVS